MRFDLNPAIGVREAAWRTAQFTRSVLEQGIAKAKAQSPDFVHALAELESAEIAGIDWRGLWAKFVAFWASDAGQMLLKIIEAMLMLLPFIMAMEPVGGPILNAVELLRDFKALAIQYNAGNWLGDGGVMDVLILLAQFLQPSNRSAPFPQPEVSMDLATLITGLETLGTDIASGNLLQAWKDSIPLQEAAIAILSPNSAMKACPCDAATAAKGDAACAALETCCKTEASKAGALPWDGSLLRNLAQFILTVLPIIWGLFKPQPAPAPVP